MALCFLCPRTPEDSTGSGSGFKASQKTFTTYQCQDYRHCGFIQDAFLKFSF